MNSEAHVICRFVPSRLEPEIIQAELRPLLPTCCRCERISVRIPRESAPDPAYDNLQWHQDGAPAHHMVVWASEMPTEIRASSGEELRFEPFDVIWFDNTKVHHRQPMNTDEEKRWFVSVRCSGAIF
jgi:hypothetical protein